MTNLSSIKALLPEIITSIITVSEIVFFPYLNIQFSPVEKLSLFLLQYVALRGTFMINRKLNKLQETVSEKRSLLIARERLEPFSDQIKVVKKSIACSGTTLGLLGHEHIKSIEDKYKEGCIIRLLLIEDSEIPKAAKMTGVDPENIRRDIANALTNLKKYKNQPSAKGGTIEVKLMPSFPGFGLLIIDDEIPQAKLKIEFFAIDPSPPKRPNIILTKENDFDWYNYFANHFEKLWSVSTEI